MVRLNPYRFLRSRHRQLHSVLANMSDFSKVPQIIDYGGRRRQFDRRQTPERPTVPDSRSGRQRRSGFDRRSIKNNARFKVKTERRADFERFREMIPEEEKIADAKMILIDNTSDSSDES
jgi:GTPase SAR1 family protein